MAARLTLVWQYFGTLIWELFLEIIRSYVDNLNFFIKPTILKCPPLLA